MIEILVRDWLEEHGITARLEMPEHYSGGQFCVIEKTGSSYRQALDEDTLAVQSYGDSLYEAAALNRAVCAAMLELHESLAVCYCRKNSDYNFTDTERKRYRYQAVFDILHYEED